MNKSDLVDALADETGLTKADAGRAIDALFSPDAGIIARNLRGEEKVQITGFGTFLIRPKRERRGRNPQTGEEMVIKPHRSIVFRPSKLFGATLAE